MAILDLFRYLAQAVIDGSYDKYDNEYLAMLPYSIQDSAYELGQFISQLLF